MKRRAASVALGLLADRLIGEPPATAHPVAAFGAGMVAAERRLYRDRRLAGMAYAAIGAGAGVAVGAAVPATALAAWLAVAGRQLGDSATAIAHALEVGEMDGARSLLPGLVGRDVGDLDEKGMARAVVESVAENTVDAVVAPALWAALAGAPGALGYRAVNTLDAMVGHRSERYERFGWASARLDDAAGWIPARLTAMLVAVARPRAATAVWRAVRVQAPAHPSPNAGVAEAAFAAALGLRLGGEVRYGGRVELRPDLGSGRTPDVGDIAAAVRLSRSVTAVMGVGLTALAAA